MHKVDGAKHNTHPKNNTYECLLILYLEHTLNHLNVSDAKQRRIRVKNLVVAGEDMVGFG